MDVVRMLMYCARILSHIVQHSCAAPRSDALPFGCGAPRNIERCTLFAFGRKCVSLTTTHHLHLSVGSFQTHSRSILRDACSGISGRSHKSRAARSPWAGVGPPAIKRGTVAPARIIRAAGCRFVCPTQRSVLHTCPPAQRYLSMWGVATRGLVSSIPPPSCDTCSGLFRLLVDKDPFPARTSIAAPSLRHMGRTSLR